MVERTKTAPKSRFSLRILRDEEGLFYAFGEPMHIYLIVFLRFIQMLIGLRETEDRIVAATFSALAVMVPILGADIVVGGERRKHFIEGRPKVKGLVY